MRCGGRGRGRKPPGPLPLIPSTSPPSLALSSLNKHTEAVAYYKKALELDPDNETYKSNLKIAELKLKETPSPVSPPGNKGCDSVGEAEHRQAGQTLPQLTVCGWARPVCGEGLCSEGVWRSFTRE